MLLTRDQYARSIEQALGVTADLKPLPELGRSLFWSDATTQVVDQRRVAGWSAVAHQLAQQLDPRALFPCSQAESACADAFIARVGRRLYRRPLESAENARMRALYDAVKAAQPHAEALRATLEAMLQAPRFLYQVDSGGLALDGYARAQRLAFALWNVAPDEALLERAANGDFDDGQLANRAREMVIDPRVAFTLQSFHHQFFSTERVTALTKDAEIYPAFSPAVARAMHDEAGQMYDDIFREGDGRFASLFTRHSTWVTSALAPVYGVAVPSGGRYRLGLDPANSAGVLTLPALLAMQAAPAGSSPIKRGFFVYHRLLCGEIGAPTGLLLTSDATGTTTRERVEAHTSSPSCSGCHLKMDPPGFALENFDGMGAFRVTESGQAVDARGGLQQTDVDYAASGAGPLGEAIARSPQAMRCYTAAWLDAFNGPDEFEVSDACGTARLARTLEQGNVRELLVQLVSRPEFLSRR